MKKFTLAALFTLALAIAASMVVAQETPTKREALIETTPTADLNASSIRVTISEFSLDRKLKLNVEKRNAGGIIIDRTEVNLTAAEVKLWINDADPDAHLNALVLTKVGLSGK